MGVMPGPETEVSTDPASEGDSPRHRRSNVNVKLRSDSSTGARWGQCVFDPDCEEFDENGDGGGPGGSTIFARDEHEVRSESRCLNHRELEYFDMKNC